MKRKNLSARSFFELSQETAEITPIHLERIECICTLIAAEIESIIIPMGNDSFLWRVHREKPSRDEKQPHFWAVIEWTQFGKVVATTSSVFISDHQTDPGNISSYTKLLIHTLETRKENAAVTAV